MGLDAMEELLGLSNAEQSRRTQVKGDIAALAALEDFLETKVSCSVREGRR